MGSTDRAAAAHPRRRAEIAWTDAIGMTGAQVAVTGYCPDWWPAVTPLPICRVALDVTAGQTSADPGGAAP